MSKRKTKIEEPIVDIDTLVTELQTAEREFKNINLEEDAKEEAKKA